jgi:hypothetical protein
MLQKLILAMVMMLVGKAQGAALSSQDTSQWPISGKIAGKRVCNRELHLVDPAHVDVCKATFKVSALTRSRTQHKHFVRQVLDAIERDKPALTALGDALDDNRNFIHAQLHMDIGNTHLHFWGWVTGQTINLASLITQ